MPQTQWVFVRRQREPQAALVGVDAFEAVFDAARATAVGPQPCRDLDREPVLDARSGAEREKRRCKARRPHTSRISASFFFRISSIFSMC